jgi:hypothetical protein
MSSRATDWGRVSLSSCEGSPTLRPRASSGLVEANARTTSAGECSGVGAWSRIASEGTAGSYAPAGLGAVPMTTPLPRRSHPFDGLSWVLSCSSDLDEAGLVSEDNSLVDGRRPALTELRTEMAHAAPARRARPPRNLCVLSQHEVPRSSGSARQHGCAVAGKVNVADGWPSSSTAVKVNRRDAG